MTDQKTPLRPVPKTTPPLTGDFDKNRTGGNPGADRAQPGDVLGIERDGETTSLGDTAEDEDERRRDALKEAADNPRPGAYAIPDADDVRARAEVRNIAGYTPRNIDDTTAPEVARDVMTMSPACCTPTTTLDEVAKMMVQNDCGEIPVIDSSDQIIGVVTDRDIVCRVVAEGKNPSAYTAESCMSQPVITVRADAPIDEVINTMEKHQIRRVPVVDELGGCAGIIAQADVAWVGREHEVAELVREVSRDTGRPSRT